MHFLIWHSFFLIAPSRGKNGLFTEHLQVSAMIQQELPRVIQKMKLYLLNPSTRTILFKPIK